MSTTKANPQIVAKLEEVCAHRDELAERLNDPEVLTDHIQVRDLSIRKAALDPVADDFERWKSMAEEADELRRAIESGEDPELAEMAREELPQLEKRAAELLDALLERLVNAEDRQVGSVMLEIRAGAGGDEAGLWAQDLLAMYQGLAERRGWKLEPIEMSQDSGMGGLRSGVFNVSGDGVYAELAHEAGTHCVKRVPATESQGRIHTSTATVAVLPEPDQVDVELDPSDVDEHITTAQGPGGQNVNKVATAVHLIHRPTGIEVRMQETKSQAQNKEKAWRLLRARLYERQLQEQREKEAAARSEQIGSGGRAERIRTDRYKDGIAVDHRLNESFSLEKTLAGDLAPIIAGLREQETARRLAAL